MRDALKNLELMRWHQMVRFGCSVHRCALCPRVHNFTAGESFGAWELAVSTFLFRP
jgi:hypothetical protein